MIHHPDQKQNQYQPDSMFAARQWPDRRLFAELLHETKLLREFMQETYGRKTYDPSETGLQGANLMFGSGQAWRSREMDFGNRKDGYLLFFENSITHDGIGTAPMLSVEMLTRAAGMVPETAEANVTEYFTDDVLVDQAGAPPRTQEFLDICTDLPVANFQDKILMIPFKIVWPRFSLLLSISGGVNAGGFKCAVMGM